MNTSSTVAIVRCGSYEPDTVENAVRRAVDLLGGIGSFVRPGERILLKPNLLGPHSPEEAVTTHPAIVRAMAELVHAAGSRAIIGDSPAFYAFARVASATGMNSVEESTGAPLVPFENGKDIPTAEGATTRRLTIAHAVAEADAIISLPKFKTHCLTHITGAIKNLLGCVPGLKKSELHYRFPDNERFSRMLVDINISLPIKLHLCDAIIGMDGNGPSAGAPFQIGLIIAGNDAVAVDSTACRVVGIDPMTIPMIRIGERCGLGTAEESRIEIVGERLEKVRVDGFRPIAPRVEVGRLIPLPRVISDRFRHWLVRKPRIVGSVCTRCGACIGICPARPKALSMEDDGVAVDDARCILCYCCNEVCPSQAVKLRRGPLAGLFARVIGIE